MFVATDATGVMGFASAGPDREDGSLFGCEVHTLYLLESHQDLGLGRNLFEHVARYLARYGCDSLRVWVLDGNPAQGFYKHLGGTRVGEEDLRIGENRFTEVGYGWTDVSVVSSSLPRGPKSPEQNERRRR